MPRTRIAPSQPSLPFGTSSFAQTVMRPYTTIPPSPTVWAPSSRYIAPRSQCTSQPESRVHPPTASPSSLLCMPPPALHCRNPHHSFRNYRITHVCRCVHIPKTTNHQYHTHAVRRFGSVAAPPAAQDRSLHAFVTTSRPLHVSFINWMKPVEVRQFFQCRLRSYIESRKKQA
jgi:hypothetical protein